MGYTQALSAYKETGVKTASAGKILIMLYDEAVRQLDIAAQWLSDENKGNPAHLEKAHLSIVKTQEIITELMASLDMDAGGDISKNLLSLYVFFNKELLDANIAKDKAKVVEVRGMVDDLRLVWHQVVRTQAATTQAVQGVNISS